MDAFNTTHSTLPTDRGRTPLRNLPALALDPLACIRAAWRRQGDLFWLDCLLTKVLVVVDPGAADHVLRTNQRNYQRSPLFSRPLRSVTGPTMFNTDGDEWLPRRRTVQPAFSRALVRTLAPKVVAAVDRQLAGLPTGVEFESAPAMARMAMAMIGSTMFDAELTDDDLVEAFAHSRAVSERRVNVPVWLPSAVPSPENRRLARTRALIEGRIGAMIDRRAAGKGRDDLLDRLMAAKDPETGCPFARATLIAEAALLVNAGHDTTAAALTCALHYIGSEPQWQARLRDEIDRELGGEAPTPEALARCSLLRQVMRETLRLHPPAWVSVHRQAVADDRILGEHVPAGTTVLVATSLLHRHPRYWDRPNAFDPERFAPEREAERPRGVYFPFGMGRRRCIGEPLAWLELEAAVARVLQRYELEAPRGGLREKAGFTLEPTRAPLTLRPR